MNSATSITAVHAAVQRGDLEEAAALAAAVPEGTSSSEALHMAALLDTQFGRLGDAVERLERAVQIDGKRAAWWRDLGVVRLSLERWSEAADAFQCAIELEEGDARSWRGLARALAAVGRGKDACLVLAQSLRLDPHSKAAHRMMAEAYRQMKRLTAARRHEEEVMRLDPADIQVRARLARDCWLCSDLPAALIHSRAVVDQGVASAGFHAFYLYLLLFDPARTGDAVRAACEEFQRRHGSQECVISFLNDPDPNKRLRVGYMTAEFKGCPPMFFLPPMIAGHNRQEVEVFLYHTAPDDDEHTQWYRDHADQWRHCHGMNDDDLLEAIRADRIDILVDPSGYAREHRLDVMARRAAPIQVSYHNYPSTRGIRQIDYFLTDAWATPEGTESQYTEKPLRLPSGSIAYVPPQDAPPVSAAPVLKNGFVTYGLFQRRAKLNDRVLDSVAAVLRRAPGARLLVQQNDGTLEQPTSVSRMDLVREFLCRGIPESRFRLVGARNRTEVMRLMSEVDVALDTFPYAGHTTTCECLWMGVPVVTLSGATHASRIGASILHSIELSRFVAHTEAGYVETAINAGSSRDELLALRDGMRQRLERTGFTASRRLSREMEEAFRAVWRDWCKAQLADSVAP